MTLVGKIFIQPCKIFQYSLSVEINFYNKLAHKSTLSLLYVRSKRRDMKNKKVHVFDLKLIVGLTFYEKKYVKLIVND